MVKGYVLLAILAVSVRTVGAKAAQDCVGAWENFGECSKTCGCGFQRKKYVVSKPAEEGGKACEAEHGDVSAESCTIKDCPNMNGVVTDWSECSATCGDGTQTRSWKWEDSTMEGEEWPEESGPYEQACNNGPCCEVSEWGEFGACDAACGEGIQFSHRNITVEGHGCPELVQNQTCKAAECPFTYTVIPNTECSGKPVAAEELEGLGEEVADEPSCRSGASSTACLSKCEGLDSCAGVDITDSQCCFLSEVTSESYHAGEKSNSCYKKPIVSKDESAGDDSPINSFNAIVIVGSAVVAYVGYGLLQSQNEGTSKLPVGSPEAGRHSSRLEPVASPNTPSGPF